MTLCLPQLSQLGKVSNASDLDNASVLLPLRLASLYADTGKCHHLFIHSLSSRNAVPSLSASRRKVSRE